MQKNSLIFDWNAQFDHQFEDKELKRAQSSTFKISKKDL